MFFVPKIHSNKNKCETIRIKLIKYKSFGAKFHMLRMKSDFTNIISYKNRNELLLGFQRACAHRAHAKGLQPKICR
ncbi:MAG TPA: hypothetical protein DEG06_12520 [Lachnospiraceae bacterium]|nr:hypothetical protein [Lachnospiraceae bacterium]HBY73056.1 hypothetical protein [Lachnospiraceae bacterium]HCA68964.1 hypothetical protein [Lachnospiraceae bacterium]HCM14048.1 hypothetical protein [Lachnospiraceae bacterium]